MRLWHQCTEPPALRGELRAAYHVRGARAHDHQLAETVSYAPDRGGGAGAQQPGSPARPQHAERVRRRRSMFTLQRSAFQRAEPGWAMLRHIARRLGAERGTSTPSSWPLLWLDEHTLVGLPLWPRRSVDGHTSTAPHGNTRAQDESTPCSSNAARSLRRGRPERDVDPRRRICTGDRS